MHSPSQKAYYAYGKEGLKMMRSCSTEFPEIPRIILCHFWVLPGYDVPQ